MFFVLEGHDQVNSGNVSIVEVQFKLSTCLFNIFGIVYSAKMFPDDQFLISAAFERKIMLM